MCNEQEQPKLFVDNEENACFPEGIIEIPDYAFYGNKKLKCAILPDTVEYNVVQSVYILMHHFLSSWKQ